ncbi:MAG: ABC transporter substrate-binding protein [Deferribacterales bacterium]
MSLQLVWHHQFQFAGYYMALEKGYYQDAGLDVNILSVKTDSTPINEVLNGRADFGISTSGVILDYFNGKPLVSVAAIFQRSPLVFVTKERPDITSIRDFAGKKVMLLDDRSSLELVALLRKYNLDDHIERIPSSFDPNDLVDDKTDVFNGYKSNEPYLLETEGVSSREFDPFDYGIKFYGDILFTTEQYLKENESTVEAFRKASLKGWKYAMNHTEETIDVIKNKYKSDKTKAHLRYEASIIQQLTQHDIVPFGFQSKERWEQIAAILHDINVVDGYRDLGHFIYEPSDSIRWREIRPFLFVFAIIVLLIILWRYHTLYKAKKTILEKEKLILQQSKYAALGEMMGAITHQLKQPLTATSMILQNLEDSAYKEEDEKMIEQGITLINHMAQTIDGFRRFYRTDRNFGTFSVAEAIKEAFELSKGYLTYNHIHSELLCSCGKRDYPCGPAQCEQLEKHCSATLSGNSNELKQIILNLIQNSREALIESDKPEKIIRVNIKTTDELIKIIFEDNGPGISKDVIGNLFDMDITSKAEGTGLGLYMCRNMIKEHYKGFITAENYEDGARFIITLPID